MNVASRISPGLSGVFSLRTIVSGADEAGETAAPAGGAAGMNSMRTVVAAETVTDFSLLKKSSLPMVATLVFDSAVHLPIEWGWARAYSFTALGARRSELPSRRTGFTALPMTLA